MTNDMHGVSFHFGHIRYFADKSTLKNKNCEETHTHLYYKTEYYINDTFKRLLLLLSITDYVIVKVRKSLCTDHRFN